MLIDIKPKEALNNFLQIYNTINPISKDLAKELIKTAIAYYSKNGKISSYHKHLEEQWYKSICSPTFPSLNQYYLDNIDYTVYDDKYYFTDLWTCWIVYSRNYIKSIIKKQEIYNLLKDVKSVVDLGCGIGYTTAALKEIFNNADVFGTNLEGTKQYLFCKEMGRKYNFKLLSDIKEINSKEGLVIAFEYFEHIQNVIDHLIEILNFYQPTYLYIANSFNTRSIGHFEWYKHYHQNNLFYSQKKISKQFNKILRLAGYQTVKTTNWNNKPILWHKNNN